MKLLDLWRRRRQNSDCGLNAPSPTVIEAPEPPAQDSAAEVAELKADIQRMEAEIERREARAQERLASDRIFYLPRGRVGGCPGETPYCEFEVTAKTEMLLNSLVASLAKKDNPPWLDLSHDFENAVFWISHFKLHDDGLFAYGRYSALGKWLRDTGRISGVSATIHNVVGAKDPAFRFEAFDFSIPPASSKPALKPAKHLAVLGGVLINGRQSAFQSCAKRAAAWKRILGPTPTFVE